MGSYPPVPPGKKLIFRATRIDPKSGKLLYAKHYGITAWPILVDSDSDVE